MRESLRARIRGIALVALALSVGACERPQERPAPRAPSAKATASAAARPEVPAWPALPRTLAEAEAMIGQQTRRDPGERAAPKLDARQLLDHPALAGRAPLIVGREAIARWVSGRLDAAAERGRDGYLLWGTFHDSREQIEAFRRWIGPGGVPGWTHIVVEQFDADGRWVGASVEAQRGDGAELSRYLASGERPAWQRLVEKQEREDYTAWKYGYLEAVMELLIAARASGTPLVGCDMPKRVQQLAPGAGDLLSRLRELHCLLALRHSVGASRRPLRVAMLWGQDHVKPHGVRRFLPRDSALLALYVMGGRGPLTCEAELGRVLTLNDPLLLPLDESGEELALLLREPPLAGEVERAREWTRPGSGVEQLVDVRVTSEERATLRLGGEVLAVGRAPRNVRLRAGASPYLLQVGRALIVGSLDLPAGSRAVLDFEPARRRTSIQLQVPAVRR